MAAGKVLKPDQPFAQVLSQIAARHCVTPAQLSLAWLLDRSPVILPIPGTARVAHLEENVSAAGLKIDAGEWAQLEAAAKD